MNLTYGQLCLTENTVIKIVKTHQFQKVKTTGMIEVVEYIEEGKTVFKVKEQLVASIIAVNVTDLA